MGRADESLHQQTDIGSRFVFPDIEYIIGKCRLIGVFQRLRICDRTARGIDENVWYYCTEPKLHPGALSQRW